MSYQSDAATDVRATQTGANLVDAKTLRQRALAFILSDADLDSDEYVQNYSSGRGAE